MTHRQKQRDALDNFRERTQNAANSTNEIEGQVAQRGVAIDGAAKQAIAEGGNLAKEAAKALLSARGSATALAVEASNDEV